MANPRSDGVVNLLKFAFNLDPTVAGAPILPSSGTLGMPRITFIDPGSGGAILKVEFLRRKNAPQLTYIPQKSSNLTAWETLAASEITVPIDLEWERVTIEEPLSGTFLNRCFGRVRILLND